MACDELSGVALVQQTFLISGWLIIPGLSLLTLAGLWVMLRGLCPRRTGTTPHCRKCGYNLTGLDSDSADARCPECGSETSAPRAVLLGERGRRWRRVLIGALLLLIGTGSLGVLAVGAARGVDWYKFKPTALVLRDIHSADAMLAGRALAEMRRRFIAGEVAPEYTSELADVCLQVHGRPAQTAGVKQAAMQLLDDMYTANLMTEEQTGQFFSQMLEVEALVRPLVVQGDPCHIGVRVAMCGPMGRYGEYAAIEGIRVDGAESDTDSHRRHSTSYSGAAGDSETVLSRYLDGALAPGKHEVTLDVRVQIGRDLGVGSEPPSTVLHEETHIVEASLEVLRERPPDLISLKHAPALDEALAAGVWVHGVSVEEEEDATEGFRWRASPHASGMVYATEPVPIGVACDVFAEIEGQRVGLGRLTASPSSSCPSLCHFWIPLDPPFPDQVTIILRSSEAAALETPDLYEIWDGELWFENVPVVTDKRGSTATGRISPEIRRRDRADDPSWPVVASRLQSFLPPQFGV